MIRKCSEVILGCVGTLRTLVDQFSALAQFPALEPRACDLNKVAEEASLSSLAVFRESPCNGIWSPCCQWSWPTLRPFAALSPTSSTTPPKPCRAVCCACSASTVRSLKMTGAIEITVSDTGHGLTDEIRERLFLPFYSTKHRGTGLGLSIAAKIVQEHGGSLRAEGNSPKGARFLMRLPLIEPPVHSLSLRATALLHCKHRSQPR
jgi:two-component system nitrogen regulation sensor histidine kinase NtrY